MRVGGGVRSICCIAVTYLSCVSVAFAGEILYNGIILPDQWPPLRAPTQEFEEPPYLESPPPVIVIDVGRQLFVDDFLIETTNLVRSAHRPVFHPGNPVIAARTAPDVNAYALPFSDGVWYDANQGLFRAWYWGGTGTGLAYAFSADGENWVRPTLDDPVVPGYPHMVLSPGSGRDSSTVWIDYADPNPAQRYKAFIYTGGGSQDVWFSPDGIKWNIQPFDIYSVSDRTTFFYNPFRQVWVESARNNEFLPDTPERDGYLSRSRSYAESVDLQNWTPDSQHLANTFWTGPDVQDPPYPGTDVPPELYNLDAVAYESVLVGLFSMFHPENGANLVELNVGFSRDGFHWSRPVRGAADDAFIPVTNQEGDWNAYNTQSAGGGFLVVGDELWFYFSGRNTRHGITPLSESNMGMGLAKLRRDGFFSMDAGATEGTLTTRPIHFSGKRLFVNVNNPSGELRAEVLDLNGNVIAPFSKGNSIPVQVDSTRYEVRWNNVTDLSAVASGQVKLRFYLTSGELYSFWITDDPNGASFGYVAAGGPGFTGPIDTTAGIPPADVTAPTRQEGRPSQSVNVRDVVLSLTTNEPATCRYATSAGVSFGSMVNGFSVTGTINHSQTLIGLPLGAQNYYVRCQDWAGNVNTDDFVISFVINPPATGTTAIWMEAESGVYTNPMKRRADATASGGLHVRSPVPEIGTLTLPFHLDRSDYYVIWARGRALDLTDDELYYSIDGGPEKIWKTSDGGPDWKWSPLEEAHDLTSGDHKIVFRGRGTNVIVDVAVVTNIVDFDPENPLDMIPPARHSGLPAGSTSGDAVTLAIQTDEEAICKFGTSPNIDYDAMVNAFTITGGLNHSSGLTALAQGEQKYYVRCQDALGNKNVADFQITFTVDNTPPSRFGGSPSGLTAGSEATLGMLTDEASVCRYDVASGIAFANMASVLVSADGLGHAVELTGLGSGPQHYSIRCQDSAGNTNSDDYSIVFEVDNTPPARSAGSPSGLVAGAGVTLGLITNESATCAYGLGAGIPFESMTSVFTSPDGRVHSAAVAALGSGQQQYSVRCQDVAGNKNIDDFQIAFEVDNAAPVRFGGSPSGVATSTEPTLALLTDEAATCRYGLVPSVAFADMTFPLTSVGGLSHSAQLTGLGGGPQQYFVRCQDAVGNANQDDLQITFQIDSAAPARSGGLPAGLITTANVTLAVTTDKTATCRYAGTPGVSYTAMTSTFATGNGFNHSKSLTGLSAGQHAYYVRCRDTAGNTNDGDFPITFQIDNTAPVRSGGSPTGAIATADVTLALSTNEAATCRFAPTPGVGFNAMGSALASADGLGHSAPLTGLEDGPHQYYVRCRDIAGNANVDDFLVLFTVGTQTVGGGSTTLSLEAESGVWTNPIKRRADYTASGGLHLRSPVPEIGTLTLPFHLGESGDYVIWVRGRALNPADDELYYSIDGGPEKIWSASDGGTTDWRWSPLEAAKHFGAGYHQVFFRSRGTNVIVDVLAISNVGGFDPNSQ